MFKFLLLLSLIQTSLADLPNESERVSVFLGEGISCDDTVAEVEILGETVTQSEAVISEIVSLSVADLAIKVQSDPTVFQVVDSAVEAAKIIADSVNEATMSIFGQIVSPNPGCWAVAFGKVEAGALAKIVVDAIVSAIETIAEPEAVEGIDAVLQNVLGDIENSAKNAALHLADGSGLGSSEESKSVLDESDVTTTKCSLVEVFAALDSSIQTNDSLILSGCVTNVLNNGNVSFPVITSGCDCYQNAGFDAPDLCGKWGDNSTDDYICYVFPLCACAQNSEIYPLLKWRYCGPTLEKMQSQLSFSDDVNNIKSVEADNGYCTDVDPSQDEIAPPASPPAGLSDCPTDICVDEAAECCGFRGGVCITTVRTRYSYVGNCASNDLQVWQLDENLSVTCTCEAV
eukprot:TRINITY_DN4292_c0_g3_i2.p1 TRINITY_DN4292_c0_g3~~TRINITY_DN4292_c0_g3_i2.p1  ORF type:complete len:416 (+),score=76.42 TRINITY_DN4292_c0_g3_i2:45-1250(+)